ncbi:MAG TPA: metallophosphoesterase [Myxococcota bacterium]|nr:metallophosphoesterase [Myxococcota bacterium]
MIRFLHSGDWQLGMTRSVLGDEAQARFADARIAVVRRLGELARAERCAFVLVCGDVFESSQVERRTLARALEAIASIPVPVYLLPGNHDPLDAASVYRSAAFRNAAPDHVHVLDDVRPRAVAPGVELLGAPWLSRRPAQNPALAALAALGPAGPLRILAAHGGADALTPDRRDASLLPLAPIERAIAEDRIHYAALGDRHSTTRVGSTGRIWYAGAPEPTDFDEREPGQALVVELDRAGVSTAPHRVAAWRFAQPGPIDLDTPDDLDALADRLFDLGAKERTALRLELRGALDLRGGARLEAILDRARDLFAGLDVRDAELRIAAREADLDGLALAGFAARAVSRLSAAARGSAPEAVAARDALALLVRLATAPEAP